MRLLYASARYPPSVGGGEIHLHELAKALALRGHRVRVVSQAPGAPVESALGAVGSVATGEYEQDGVPVRLLGFDAALRARMRPFATLYKNRLARGSAVRRISRWMLPDFAAAAGGPADLVHAIRMGPPFLAAAALLHARATDAPYVITAIHHPDWTAARQAQYARLYREADAVIALTAHEKRVLVESMGVREERVHVTGVGPVLAGEQSVHAVEAFRARHGLAGPYVLFVGRKVPHKGWDTMLAAAPRVLERFPRVSFVFVGEDDARSLARFASARDPRVRNLGKVDLAEKTAALAGCEMLCLPSTSESFGGVFTEAWAFGKPVIAGDIPPVAEVVAHEADGLLVPQDPQAVASAVLSLLERPEEARRMGEAGRRKVGERYGWDRLAEATLAIYRLAVRSRTAAST